MFAHCSRARRREENSACLASGDHGAIRCMRFATRKYSLTSRVTVVATSSVEARQLTYAVIVELLKATNVLVQRACKVSNQRSREASSLTGTQTRIESARRVIEAPGSDRFVSSEKAVLAASRFFSVATTRLRSRIS